jgi:hypothetical protein
MNQMVKLLNKIERRLGTRPLNLPEQITKDKWASEVIENETLDTFSRYFPHKILYVLSPDNRKGDYFLIDEDTCENQEIVGVGDIDWHLFSSNAPAFMLGGGYGTFDMMTSSYDVEDIAMTQMMADHASLFSNGIYIDFQPPNKVKLTCAISNNYLNFMRSIPINLFVKHPSNLMTIEPSKMETFENLAQADIAKFLFEYLKYYDGVETVFASTDLKLSDLEEEANKRMDIVQELKESYVSAANKNMPLMLTIN